MKNSARFCALCLVLVFLCTLMPVSAADSVTPDEFPDHAFRTFVFDHFDLDHNGLLSPEECSSVTKLEIPNMNIFSLEGLHHFPNLEELFCSGNQLSNLFLDKLQNLKTLICSNNPLYYLDVTDAWQLSYLDCSMCRLNALNIPHENLRFLDCTLNPLTRLEMPRAYLLQELYCSNTRLETLDVGVMPYLTALHCFNCRLTQLDTSLFPVLKELYCSGNLLSELACSSVVLEILDCSDNRIRSLDLSATINRLTALDCSGNQLEALDLVDFPRLSVLNCSGNLLTKLRAPSSLTNLICSGNGLTELNPACLQNLESLDISDNHFVTLGLENAGKLTSLNLTYNPLPGVVLPDGSACQIWGGDSVYLLAPSERSSLSDLIPQADQLRITDAVNCFVDYSANQLIFDEGCTEASFKFNTGVGCMNVTVYLVQDPLPINEANFPDPQFRKYLSTILDRNGDGILHAEERNQPWMDISYPFSLNKMDIADLTGLSHFPHLQHLNVAHNQLQTLDVSGNPELQYIYCFNNQLSQLDVTDCPDLIILNCSGNRLTDLKVATNQGASVLDCSENQLRELDTSKMTGLYTLFCGKNQLQELTLNRGMYKVDCSGNYLRELDLSENRNLHYLDCNSNILAELDLTDMNDLEFLDCTNNRMAGLDGRNLKNCTTYPGCNVRDVYSRSVSFQELGLAQERVGSVRFGTFENGIFTFNPGSTHLIYDYEVSPGFWVPYSLYLMAPQNIFTDVPEDEYFYDPVYWAVSKGITQGMTDSTFGPKMNCRREQVVTFLWRYAGKPEAKGENPFTDVRADHFFYEPVLWAVENDITNGMSATSFGPKLEVTRAQVVTFLWRLAGKPGHTSEDHPFIDLDPEEWYYDAVLWAVEQGITQGMKPNEFQPKTICQRAQVVTFLYRYDNVK